MHNGLLYNLYTVDGQNVGDARNGKAPTGLTEGQTNVVIQNIDAGAVNGEPVDY